MKTDLLVSEIFGPTLQGEGPSIGRPCVFLRVGACNLNCSWCDTPYTWAFSDRKASLHDSGVRYDKTVELRHMLIEDAGEELRRHLDLIPADPSGFEDKLVVLSGGEPMLQQVALTRLINEYLFDCVVEIETAGTLAPRPALRELENVWFNVSPKLRHSGNTDAMRYKPKALAELATHPRAVFKFVVGDLVQLEEIQEDFVKPFLIESDRMYIMPLGVEPREIIESMQELAEPVIARGWNLTTRLHTLIWGTERGR